MPLGGALFTVEVLLASVSIPVVVPAAATAAIATAVAWLALTNRPTYNVAATSISATIATWAVLAGPVLALARWGFSQLTTRAAAHRPQGARLPVATVVVFTALGALAIAYPQLLGNGKGAAQLAFDGTLSLAVLGALLVLKPIATAACLGSGAPLAAVSPLLWQPAARAPQASRMRRWSAGRPARSPSQAPSAPPNCRGAPSRPSEAPSPTTMICKRASRVAMPNGSWASGLRTASGTEGIGDLRRRNDHQPTPAINPARPITSTLLAPEACCKPTRKVSPV